MCTVSRVVALSTASSMMVAVPLPEPSGKPSSDDTIRAGGSTSRNRPLLA
jgi:hypothetical protein